MIPWVQNDKTRHLIEGAGCKARGRTDRVREFLWHASAGPVRVADRPCGGHRPPKTAAFAVKSAAQSRGYRDSLTCFRFSLLALALAGRLP